MYFISKLVTLKLVQALTRTSPVLVFVFLNLNFFLKRNYQVLKAPDPKIESIPSFKTLEWGGDSSSGPVTLGKLLNLSELQFSCLIVSGFLKSPNTSIIWCSQFPEHIRELQDGRNLRRKRQIHTWFELLGAFCRKTSRNKTVVDHRSKGDECWGFLL